MTEPAPTDLTDRIREVAAGPAQASDAAGSVTAHKPTDLIAVDQYLDRKAAAKQPFGGVRFLRIVSPGSR